MKEVLHICIGNLACHHNSQFWNDLEPYFGVKGYEKDVLFSNEKPRVIYIDYEENFAETIGFDCKEEGNELVNIDNEYVSLKPMKNKTSKDWLTGYQYKQNLNSSNCIKMKRCSSLETEPENLAYNIINKIIAHDNFMKINNFHEVYYENMRRAVEECDNLNGFQISTDCSAPFGLLLPSVLDILHDDFEKKVVCGLNLEPADDENRLKNGFYAFYKMFIDLAYYNSQDSIYFPIKETLKYQNIVNSSNMLWTMPNSTNSGKVTLFDFVRGLSDISFGTNCRGAMGSALYLPKSNLISDIFDSWSKNTAGLNNYFSLLNNDLKYDTNIYSQYYILSDIRDASFKSFSDKIGMYKWKEALNCHIPASCIHSKDVLDACLNYNYYGSRTNSSIYSEQVGSKYSSAVSVFYNSSSVTGFLNKQYELCSKFSPFIKKIIGSKSTCEYSNSDFIDDSLSELAMLAKEHIDDDYDC